MVANKTIEHESSERRRSESGSFLPRLRRFAGTAVVAAGLALVSPGLLRAQQDTGNAQPAKTSESSKLFTTSVFDTTQSIANTLSTQLATKSVFNLGNNSTLWVVGGEQNKINETTSLNTTSYDLGLKLTLNEGAAGSWIRGTALNDADIANKFSYGTDMFLRAFTVHGITGLFIGGISSMDLSSDIKRHTNYDAGFDLNFGGTQHFFAVLDSKGIATSTTETVKGRKRL